MAHSKTPRLSEIAAKISENAKTLEKFIDENNLPQPTFSADGPAEFPVKPEQQAASAARFAIIDATKQLRDLVIGPTDTLRWMVMIDHNLTAALQSVYHFKIAQAVPLDGDISFRDLGKAIGLSEMNTARIVRMVMTNKIFLEPRPGYVSHSATSILLARDEGLQSVVGHMTAAAFPSSAKMVDCLQQFHGSEEPQHSPYAMVFGDPFFGYMAKHPELMQRFGACMSSWASGNEEQQIVGDFDWSSLGDGLVIDVGGSQGHISVALAKAFPRLKFQVQDFPHLANAANSLIDSNSVTDRVTFTPHDFFQPQPTPARSATVYFLRYILHDWSDAYARKILTNIVEAMTDKSRIIIADAVCPPPGALPEAQEAMIRAFDVSMFVQLNARERAVEDWEALLKSVDDRLSIASIKPPPPGGSCAMIEVQLTKRH